MSGINATVMVDWAKVRLIGPSSGSLLSPSTYVSITDRNKEGRELRGGNRENKEGKEEAAC